MTVITIAAVGIAAVLLAVSLKGVKGEYGTYLIIAAGFFIFFYGMGKLTAILDTISTNGAKLRPTKSPKYHLTPTTAKSKSTSNLIGA